MSTTRALVSDYSILSVKLSIDGIGWNEQYRERLEKFVNIIHATTTHAYSLSKFIFLCTFQDDAMHYRRCRVGEATARRHAFIGQYIQKYLDLTSYIRLGLKYAQQSSSVEGLKMYTAYINNIGAHFGNHFRRAINTLLQIHQRKADLIRQRQEEGVNTEAISNEIYEQATLLARQFKELLFSRIVDPSSIELLFQDPIYNQALQRLTPILTSYPVRYTFEQNNIYYDAKANPCGHMMAFYHLVRLFEALTLPIFNCFLLCRTWIHGNATIDTLKSQESDVLRFRETIQIDSVGVTVLKKRQARKHQYIGLQNTFVEPEPYITDLNAQQHGEITGRCVTIDPGS
ncbi:hypothetical protein G6F61_007329 [Rhizopus arrhizus]|nr:hypothetical protein G6F61_007329 [Rhizopus arrhizus]